MTEETNATTTDYPQGHCCVAHENADGPCSEPFAVEVYGLSFCELHGNEARTGAALEEHHEVWTLLERFRNDHVQPLPSPLERSLSTALDHLHSETPAGATHLRALQLAYPNPPERVGGGRGGEYGGARYSPR